MLLCKRVSLLCLLAFSTTTQAGFWSDSAATTTEEEENNEPKASPPEDPVEYGVDVSFPIHHDFVSNNYNWLPHNVDSSIPTPNKYKDMVRQPLAGRQEFYDKFLSDCVKHFGRKGQRCVVNEEDRIAMSLRQPQSMQNYTEIGFKKIRAPDEVFTLIKEFWEKNKDKAKPEQWGVGNTYTNNWESQSSMVSVEDSGLRGGGRGLKQKIWNAARNVIQEWTGQELTECSLYGIRVYPTGSVLATHVDRLPLVSSAIINVAQDVDEPWPLEVYGHDGKATNVTMLPGDMVLYESHSVLHGRPFPLKGRFMANIFIHFEPVGHSLRHNAKESGGGDMNKKYKDALQRGSGGHETDLPPYVIPGSKEEAHWRQQHPGGIKSGRKSSVTGSTFAHKAAQGGDLVALQREVARKKDVVHAKDSNGWTPFHEAARAGHMDVAKYLLEQGSDINQRTNTDGGTALWWAKQELGEDHPMIDLLESMGALEIGPDL
jgi:prolyl 4-hydroxylase